MVPQNGPPPTTLTSKSTNSLSSTYRADSNLIPTNPENKDQSPALPSTSQTTPSIHPFPTNSSASSSTKTSTSKNTPTTPSAKENATLRNYVDLPKNAEA